MLDLLLNESFVRSAMGWLAMATPAVAALLIFFGVGKRHATIEERDEALAADEVIGGAERSAFPLSRVQIALFLFGLAGPAIWMLWHAYEAIMNAFGFSSVAGLLLTLALFAVVGIGAGWAAARLWACAEEGKTTRKQPGPARETD
jgi:hypothetical protein